MTVTLRVLPRWRVYHQGRVHESGEPVVLPVLQAAEWSAWGSAEKPMTTPNALTADVMTAPMVNAPMPIPTTRETKNDCELW